MISKKIIITGITGFVGTSLEPYLNEADYSIVGVSRGTGLGKNIVAYDNLTKKMLDSSFAFIHLGGKAHDLKNISNESEYYIANTELTKNVFDKFLESECEVFIFMSSIKAVADKPEVTITEDYEPRPITAYGKSKLEAERYVLSKALSRNKRIYILRPCMIHGPNNKGNMNLLFNIISRGIPYPLGKYENKRSFLTIENMCFVIKELLINKDIKSGVYNVCDDEYLSTNQLVKLIKDEARILNIPKPIIQILARIGDFLPFPLSSEKLNKLTNNYVVSNRKIISAIKKELPLSAKEGVKKTIDSFRS